jgi:hypothetical protein
MNGNNDFHHNVKQVQAIIPATIGANATKTGPVIDRQNYGGVEWVIDYGAVTTTGTIVTIVAREGDVTGTMTSIADGDLFGTEALASLLAGARAAGTGKEVSKRLGYNGSKRYVQLLAVQTGVTSVGGIAATALLFNPNQTETGIANP